MRLLEKFRALAFWLFDFLKGSPIRKHYIDVCKTMENFVLNRPDTESENKLSKILSHAISTTKFYESIRINSQLVDFPVINKNIIREHFNEFISSKFALLDLIPVVTSGSTGTPFKILQNKEKKIRNTADTLYFGNQAGYNPGQKLYYLKIWNEINKKSNLLSWLQNIRPINVFDLSDYAIGNLIDKLNSDKSIMCLLGYASAYEAICRYMDANALNPVKSNVKAIIAMSEGLNEYTKFSMKKYFNAPVVSRYSNVENGMLAQQYTDDSNIFFINHASYKIEILNINNDNPSPFGELGRIVVTDFYNFGMPMIRYDTGDIGIMCDGQSIRRGTSYISKIEGRRMDQVFNTSCNLVSSFTITNNMWKYTEIKQYQFIQQAEKKYLFKLNVDSNFQREVELIKEFTEYFGSDAIINVTYVDEIPLLSSGKRKKVINEHINS